MNIRKITSQNRDYELTVNDSSIKKTSRTHHLILERASKMLIKCCPETESVIAPMMPYMMHVIKKPDMKGDREKGMGKHYYSAVTPFGKKRNAVNGYYANGLGKPSPSARTIFEEDYTMALTMYNAGFLQKSAGYLGRAVHMMSDMCCLPHAVAMTYFSPNRNIHKAYENIASEIYAEMETRYIKSIPDIFADREGFGDVLNKNAEAISEETELIETHIADEIKKRLRATEVYVCALLKRFCEDIKLSPDEAHYIADGMTVRLSESLEQLSTKVTQKGIQLLADGEPISILTGDRAYSRFSIAHRMNGNYTIAVSGNNDGKVITYGTNKIVNFAPDRKDLFFVIL